MHAQYYTGSYQTLPHRSIGNHTYRSYFFTLHIALLIKLYLRISYIGRAVIKEVLSQEDKVELVVF